MISVVVEEYEKIILNTKTLFKQPYKPYIWYFHVNKADRYAGTCVCCALLKECHVLQYALKDEKLDTNIYADRHEFNFIFFPKDNPNKIRKTISDICAKCPAQQKPWKRTK